MKQKARNEATKKTFFCAELVSKCTPQLGDWCENERQQSRKTTHRWHDCAFTEKERKKKKTYVNPLTAMGHFHEQPPRWPTFLAMLFQILKEGMGLSLLDELEVQYHVIKK